MEKNTLENRFNRLEGQLKKLHQDISTGKECTDVIPQFLAVKGALSAAFEEYVKQSLDSCARTDSEKMGKLIALLARR